MQTQHAGVCTGCRKSGNGKIARCIVHHAPEGERLCLQFFLLRQAPPSVLASLAHCPPGLPSISPIGNAAVNAAESIMGGLSKEEQPISVSPSRAANPVARNTGPVADHATVTPDAGCLHAAHGQDPGPVQGPGPPGNQPGTVRTPNRWRGVQSGAQSKPGPIQRRQNPP